MQNALPMESAEIEPATRAKKKTGALIFAFAGLLAASLPVYFVLRARMGKASMSPAASWVSPELRRIDSTVTTSGTIRIRSGAEVRVGSQVSGIVKKLNVTVGSRIQRGNIIAEIDPQTLMARLQQTRAQLEMDRIALAKTQRDLARGRQLFDSGLIPSQQIEDLEWQVKSAQAKVDKSRSDSEAAQVDLSYTVIRAPISGIVASVSTQEGETVAASFAAPTFVTIVEDNALELLALVDETDIAGVKPGDPVSFTVEAYPSRELAGTVKRIDPTATIISGVVNYPVIASIQKGIRLLKPDMTANISIRTAEHQALILPNAAIQRDGEERFVYVTRNDKQVKQRVTIGTRDGSISEIKKGLSVNDHVIVNSASGSQKKEQTQ